MRDMTNTPERRFEALEAAQFRTGSDLADLRTEVGHIYSETRGLGEWVERAQRQGEARHDEMIQRSADLSQELDFIRGDITTLGNNIRAIMRHLGISEAE